LYLIPYPEKSRMIMVNIVGVEWPDYSRDMTADEIQQFKPLLRASGGKETLADTAKISKITTKEGGEDKVIWEDSVAGTEESTPDQGLPFD
jgi:hypothetical protein